MKPVHGIICVSLALVSATLFGQQPATGAQAGRAAQAPPPPAPAIDLSGYWTPVMHEDALERGAGNEIADFGGFPLNEAGRLFALSYDASRVTLRHHQCEGYQAPYQMRATGNFRIWEERDSRTQQLIAIHVYGQTTEGHRVVWMDGRPHPPAWAERTFRGFSTGRFVGNALVVRTTHLKQGWLRRNGTPSSDEVTMTDYFMRYADHITNVTVVNDPVFMSEPMVRSNDYARVPVDHQAWLYACDDGEQILDRAPDYVPHYLFGKQPYVREFSQKYNLPLAASVMGAPSMYPEFAAQVRAVTNHESWFSPAPGRPSETSRAVAVEPRDGNIHVLPVRNNVYMLVGDGANIVVQTGEQGAFVVDTGEGKLSDKVIAAIRTVSAKPIQFIANTSARLEHTGGNDALAAAGQDPSLPGSFFVNSAPRGVTGLFADPSSHATMIAHNNVMVRMQARNAPVGAVPGDTFLEERRRKFHNGDAVEMFHMPNAVTDGDSIVHFRSADVIVAGEIYTTTHYPVIDLTSGGSVQGLIRALNAILDRTVFRHQGEGGTYVVPGHGYLSDEQDVLQYRDMLVIVRDRVKALLDGGATLAQIKAARVTADYDTRYGANTGAWTTEKFVEAVYNSLRKQPATR
jgi:cyclase